MEPKIIETHPLAPFLPPNAKVLMMGTFPPPLARWSVNFYYPNFTNDMWRIMGLIFFQDKNHFLDIENKVLLTDSIQAFLCEVGFALNDTVYKAHRLTGNASDKFLEVIEERDIRGLLAQIPECEIILTTGEKAMSIACAQFGIDKVPKVGEFVDIEYDNRTLRLYRMPSSSRAYPLKLEKKAAIYQAALVSVFPNLAKPLLNSDNASH